MTLQEVVLGFAAGAVVGVGFAILIHLSETARRALYPLLVASQTIPIIVLGADPGGLVRLRDRAEAADHRADLLLPDHGQHLDGLRSVDPDLLKMMRTLGAGRLQTLRRAEAPWALPYTFSGAKIAVAVAVIGAVFAEWAGSD